MVQCVKSSSTKGNAAMGFQESEARQCAKVERHPIILIQMTRCSRKPCKNERKKVRPSNGSRYARKAEDDERLVPAGMPAGESSNIQKSMHACIVEAHESTRKRLERTLSKDHDDHIAEKGFNSLSHYNLAHKFVPMPQALKIPGAQSAVDKE